MKKLIICILALTTAAGFASCRRVGNNDGKPLSVYIEPSFLSLMRLEYDGDMDNITDYDVCNVYDYEIIANEEWPKRNIIMEIEDVAVQGRFYRNGFKSLMITGIRDMMGINYVKKKDRTLWI